MTDAPAAVVLEKVDALNGFFPHSEIEKISVGATDGKFKRRSRAHGLPWATGRHEEYAPRAALHAVGIES